MARGMPMQSDVDTDARQVNEINKLPTSFEMTHQQQVPDVTVRNPDT